MNSRLARFPVGLFAMPLGLFALAGAWRRALGFGWDFALPVANALASFAVVLLLVFSVIYLAKSLLHPQVLLGELTHPFISSLMALIPLSHMMCCAYYGQAHDNAWLAYTLVALALQAGIALRIVSHLATGRKDTVVATPALYLPPVGGGLVGALAMNTLGYPGWAGLLFGIGLAGWALLEARVLHMLFAGPLPEPMRPSIGVEMAPPTVATLVAGSIWPGIAGEVLIVGLGVACAPIVAVMARWQWWSNVPFSVGFWSFSFPVAAFVGAVVEVVRRGAWPHAVGGVALAVASMVVAFLTLRTFVLLVQGRILMPAPRA